MAERKVKVTIADDYLGLTHQGREVAPGEEIEVWESQRDFLRSVGALASDSAVRKAKRDEKKQEPKEALTDTVGLEAEPEGDTIPEG